MQGPQEADLEFLDTVVLDMDICSGLDASDYDGGETDVLSEEMLRMLQRDFD
jgi:hypothetical protein